MRRPLKFRRNMINMARWGWHASLTGSEYRNYTLVHRRRHKLVFNIAKALGKKWSS